MDQSIFSPLNLSWRWKKHSVRISSWHSMSVRVESLPTHMHVRLWIVHTDGRLDVSITGRSFRKKGSEVAFPIRHFLLSCREWSTMIYGSTHVNISQIWILHESESEVYLWENRRKICIVRSISSHYTSHNRSLTISWELGRLKISSRGLLGGSI